MDNYQPNHDFTLSHPGENNPEAQSTSSPHPAQHTQGVMDNTHPVPTQISAAEKSKG